MQYSNEIEAKINKAFEKYGDAAIRNMVARLKAIGKEDSNIIKKLSYDFKIDLDGFEVSFFLPDYWIYIQYGRKVNSKMPPEKSILDWMKRKGIDKKYAFPIRKNIAKYGIPAHDIISGIKGKILKDLLTDLTMITGLQYIDEINSTIKEMSKQ